jgi:hypothetical protein
LGAGISTVTDTGACSLDELEDVVTSIEFFPSVLKSWHNHTVSAPTGLSAWHYP